MLRGILTKLGLASWVSDFFLWHHHLDYGWISGWWEQISVSFIGWFLREGGFCELPLPSSFFGGFWCRGWAQEFVQSVFFYSCLKFKEGRILRTTSPFPIIRQEIPGGGEGWGVFHKCFLIRVWNFKEGRILRTTSPFPIIRQEIPEGCEGWGVVHNCTPWQVQQLILFF